MLNKKHNKRLLELTRSSESRLKKLPGIIRKEFGAGSDRQLSALAKIERAIELVGKETAKQRQLLEGGVGNDSSSLIAIELP